MRETWRFAWDFVRKEKNIPADRYCPLIDAATVHDIGKYFTKTFIDMKGNQTSEAHYYGHENVGAYVAISIMNNDRALGLNFSADHALRMASLISWHMRPCTAWKQSEKARERDRKMIGEEMYQDIMLLHKADMAAH